MVTSCYSGDMYYSFVVTVVTGVTVVTVVTIVPVLTDLLQW